MARCVLWSDLSAAASCANARKVLTMTPRRRRGKSGEEVNRQPPLKGGHGRVRLTTRVVERHRAEVDFAPPGAMAGVVGRDEPAALRPEQQLAARDSKTRRPHRAGGMFMLEPATLVRPFDA